MDNMLGEIRPFSFNYVPEGWHLCDGTILLISENQALFTLLGFTFGGDGRTTFALPDLRGRCVVGYGVSPQSRTPYPVGSKGGDEAVTLTQRDVPSHMHHVQVGDEAGNKQLPGNQLAVPDVPSVQGAEVDIYAFPGSQQVSLNPQTISTVGGKPHNNMQPFQVINYCIAIKGYYPQRP